MAEGAPFRRALVDLEEGRANWLREVSRLPAEEVGVCDAAGRVLAEDVRGVRALPAFDRSAVDGYALRAIDSQGAHPSDPVVLPLGGEVAAGEAPKALRPGETVRVNTGSAMPQGADAVAMVEWVTLTESAGRTAVVLRQSVPPGTHVRVLGEDARAGAVLLTRGTVVAPDVLPLLIAASAGRRVLVYRMPRVVVIPTGSELTPPDEPPSPFGVPDVVSEGLARRIAGSAPGEGIRAEVSWLDPVPDTLGQVEKALSGALGQADLVCSVGGAALGTRDHTRRAIEGLGGRIIFHGLALRPGTPTLGANVNGHPVLGLPGNPVAALTAWDLLGWHALAALTGREGPALYTALLAHAMTKRSTREDRYLRAALWIGPDGRFLAAVDRTQNAGMLGPLARTNGFVCHPRHTSTLEAGAPVRACLTGALGHTPPEWFDPT